LERSKTTRGGWNTDGKNAVTQQTGVALRRLASSISGERAHAGLVPKSLGAGKRKIVRGERGGEFADEKGGHKRRVEEAFARRDAGKAGKV